jgi:multiple sugar transport system permease protein
MSLNGIRAVVSGVSSLFANGKTLPLAPAGFQSVNGADTPLLTATSVLITLPCLAIFFLSQKQITNGITFTGGR